MTDLLRISDLKHTDVISLFETCQFLKHRLQRGEFPQLLTNRAAALVFQKPSLRTRVTFDLGMKQLGGHAIYLAPQEIGLGTREPVSDIARNLERWIDVIVARVFGQDLVDGLAHFSSKPVINALSDEEHPCQALADFFTLWERGVDLTKHQLAYVGDGNNICNSLVCLAAIMGMDMRVAAPAGYEPPAHILEFARQQNIASGGKLLVTNDPQEAVHHADSVYTDVWASMGQEAETEKRAKDFTGFRVTRELMQEADAGAFFMHDLPAHRGEEVDADVIDGPHSICFDQAENRLHIQKAIILRSLDVTV